MFASCSACAGSHEAFRSVIFGSANHSWQATAGGGEAVAFGRFDGAWKNASHIIGISVARSHRYVERSRRLHWRLDGVGAKFGMQCVIRELLQRGISILSNEVIRCSVL